MGLEELTGKQFKDIDLEAIYREELEKQVAEMVAMEAERAKAKADHEAKPGWDDLEWD